MLKLTVLYVIMFAITWKLSNYLYANGEKERLRQLKEIQNRVEKHINNFGHWAIVFSLYFPIKNCPFLLQVFFEYVKQASSDNSNT